MELADAIEYRTLDVELESDHDMSPLVEFFGEEIFLLHNGLIDSKFYTSFEPKYFEPQDDTPERHAVHILALIASLPDSLRQMWNLCSSKIFDFGFNSGFNPSRYFTDLSPDTIRGIASVDASVRISIYPVEAVPEQGTAQNQTTDTAGEA